MSSITAYPISGSGFTRVEIDWSDIYGPPRKAWVYRVVGGVATTLRQADPAWLSGGRAVVYDAEAPLDVAVTYRSTCPLNQNGDMEDGVAEWTDPNVTGTIGTVTQTFDYYVRGEGRASLKLVPSGAATSRAVAEMVAATPGVTYAFSGMLMVPAAWSGGIGIQVHWYNNVTFLSSSGAANDFWPTPGEWGSYAFTATAPATTTAMRIVATITGSPPSTLPLYVDEMYITRSGVTTINATPVTLDSGGNGWWKDPLHPATALKLQMSLTPGCPPSGVVYGGLTSMPTYASDSALLDINDSDTSVGTWARRKVAQSGLRVGTATIADKDAVKALHAPNAPLFLQLPAAYSIPDHYGLHGDVEEGYLGPDQRKPWRVIQSGFTMVAPPVGPAEGVLGVRYMDLNRFATYQDAETSGGALDTWSRTVANGLGVADSGQTWAITGTAANFSVSGSQGSIQVSAVNSHQAATLPLSLSNVRLYVDRLSVSAAAAGTGNIVFEIKLRYVDANNFVSLRVFRAPGGTVTTAIRQLVAGVETFVGFPTVAGVAATDDISILYEVNGTTQKGTIWKRNTVMPSTPTITQTVTFTSAGGLQVDALAETGTTTTLPVAQTFDDFRLANLSAPVTWWDLMQGEGHV